MPSDRPRLLFAGVPCIAAARALWQLCEMGWVPLAFLDASDGDKRWRFDRRLRRGGAGWSVSAALGRYGIRRESCLEPADWEHALDRHRPDLLVSCYYPRRVPSLVLQAMPSRCLNLHPALLPAYRGPVPQIAMALAGEADRYGGMTLHVMAERFDRGPIVAQEAIPLGPQDDLVGWELDVARAGAALISEALPPFLAGQREAVEQDESKARYVRMRDLTFGITPEMTAEQALRTAQVIDGTRYALTCRVGARRVRIVRPGRVAGKATGEPPRIGFLRVSFDVADARLDFTRRLPGESRRRNRRRLGRFRRERP